MRRRQASAHSQLKRKQNETSSFHPPDSSTTDIQGRRNYKKVDIRWVVLLLVTFTTYIHFVNTCMGETTDIAASLTSQTVSPSTTIGKTSHEEKDQSDTHLRKEIKDEDVSNEPLRKEIKDEDVSNEPNYHVIFSTDCSRYQHWQSYLLFHSAFKVKQPGTVTRIASGCSDEEREAEKIWHHDNISDIMGDHFKIHFTPDYSRVKSEDNDNTSNRRYKYFNKSFGVLHWFEFGDISVGDKYETVLKHSDDIIILLDPDMILLKPITNDFSKEHNAVHQKERKYFVKKGTPFAQRYGVGIRWREFDLDKIAGPDSPAKNVSFPDAVTFYPVGPPYVATTSDMYQITLKWTEFAHPVFAQYPELLSEMNAYIIAAAHLNLKHQVLESLMVSNTKVKEVEEGWHTIDNITPDKVDSLCQYASQSDHSQYPTPSVIHYCQSYTSGDWYFEKRDMFTGFFNCDSPLMEFPPFDITEKANQEVRRNGFMICGVIGALNDAALFFKENNCMYPGQTNKEKKIRLHNLARSTG